MPDNAHPPVLSTAQIEDFIQNGFVRVERAFPRQLADEGRAILWRHLPCVADDPSTWTRPVVRLGHYDDEAFNKAVNSSVLHAAFDNSSARGAGDRVGTSEPFRSGFRARMTRVTQAGIST